MTLLHAFDSQEKRQMKSQVLDLIRMALADGVIDDSEMKYITDFARKFSISADEIEAIIQRPEDFIFDGPENRQEAVDRMFNLVGAMLADGEIHENEMKLCRFYAISLGFDDTKIDELIEQIIDSIHEDEDDNAVYEHIEDILKGS